MEKYITQSHVTKLSKGKAKTTDITNYNLHHPVKKSISQK